MRLRSFLPSFSQNYAKKMENSKGRNFSRLLSRTKLTEDSNLVVHKEVFPSNEKNSNGCFCLMALLVKAYSMTFLFVVKRSSFMFDVAVGLTAKEDVIKNLKKDDNRLTRIYA